LNSTALFTDRYELSMVAGALRSHRADAECVFEVFARHLPSGRRFGVVAGHGRVLEAIHDFTFDAADLDWLRGTGFTDEPTLEFLRHYRFTGSIDGYPEGELYFPLSPVLTIRGGFAECVVLETLVLSILNHDCAVASAAARMVLAARGRPLIDMGSRRTHEHAAVAAARAAHIAGFSTTSNLAAGRRYGIPTAGTASHASVLLQGDEAAAFAAQLAVFGPATTLLVDTYDISQGIRTAVEMGGPELTAIRIDSGDLGSLAEAARRQLDDLGNLSTKILLSGDLDEYSIAALAAAPVDAYGVGTSLVVGSGAPTAGLVYKLVEVEGRPVAKRSDGKATIGGAKVGVRAHRPSGTAVEEFVVTGTASSALPAGTAASALPTGRGDTFRTVSQPLWRDGHAVGAGRATIEEARERCAMAIGSLPWEGLSLGHGEPALHTTVVTAG
jgi:nicotinate phosphoribosyltransferase